MRWWSIPVWNDDGDVLRVASLPLLRVAHHCHCKGAWLDPSATMIGLTDSLHLGQRASAPLMKCTMRPIDLD